MTEAEFESIRLWVRRDRPYGTESWTRSTAAQFDIQSSLRSRGTQRRGGHKDSFSRMDDVIG